MRPLSDSSGGMCIGIYCNVRKNKEIHFSFKRMRFDGETVKEIYIVGVPSILMMSIGSVMTYGMNKILLGFSSTAAAVFGVYFKLQSFFFMPVFGLNNSLVPIIAYNYGAKKPDRITKTIRFSGYGCWNHASGICSIPAVPSGASEYFQRFRYYAGDWNTGSSHYQF